MMMIIAEQSVQKLKMACGTVQSALTRTLQRHLNVQCVMFVKEHPLGNQMLVNFFISVTFSDYAVCLCSTLKNFDYCECLSAL